jgi:hypothetical protein
LWSQQRILPHCTAFLFDLNSKLEEIGIDKHMRVYHTGLKDTLAAGCNEVGKALTFVFVITIASHQHIKHFDNIDDIGDYLVFSLRHRQQLIDELDWDQGELPVSMHECLHCKQQYVNSCQLKLGAAQDELRVKQRRQVQLRLLNQCLELQIGGVLAFL